MIQKEINNINVKTFSIRFILDIAELAEALFGHTNLM